MQENSLTWGRGWAAFNVMIQYAQIRGQLSPYSCCELGGATPVRWTSLPTGPSFTLPEEESIPCFQTLLSCFLALKSYQVCSVRATCHRLPCILSPHNGLSHTTHPVGWITFQLLHSVCLYHSIYPNQVKKGLPSLPEWMWPSPLLNTLTLSLVITWSRPPLQSA